MFTITLEGDRQLDVDLAETPGMFQQFLVHAINRSLTTGRATWSRLIAKDIGMRVSDVKNATRVRSATYANVSGELGMSLARQPLIAFGASGPEPSRGRGRGVTYHLGGQTRRLPHAFIATVTGPLPSGVRSPGHRGVFVRAAELTHRSKGGWSKNLPIVQRFGPSLGHVGAKYRIDALGAMADACEKDFTHSVDRATPATVSTTVSDAGTD